MSEQDHGTTEGKSNPVGVAIAVFIGTIGLVIGIMLLAQFAIGTRPLGAGLDKAAAEAAVKERIAPDVIIVTSATKESGPVAPTPPAVVAAPVKVASGDSVYKAACSACHTAGVAGAPKSGDKAAWAPRIAQGKETLYKHSIGGFQGKMGVMPAKGGNASLSDADVKAAVDYMLAAVK
ncbi:MAG: c-type cytochrome [Burkholderiales bacterium]